MRPASKTKPRMAEVELKLKDDPQAASLVKAMVLDMTGSDIDVTTTKTGFKGSQTTGGVKKKFKLRIAYKGTVATSDGPKKVRGRLKTKGVFE